MNSNYQKKDIAKYISDETGYSINYSKKLVNDIVECIIDNIKYNELSFKNFGVLKTISKPLRMGRNPKTKKEYIIYPKKTLKFVSSKNLKIDITDI